MRNFGVLKMTVIGMAACLALNAEAVSAAQQPERSAPGSTSQAQVKPKDKDHVSEFLEDPFVTKYRRLFFSVFNGKMDGYAEGMKELEAMLAKNPNDARALVWHGNGLMIRGGLQRFRGQRQEAVKSLVDSRKELDRAVSLDPENVSILAMRAVTIFGMGTYFNENEIPAGSWQKLISDLEKSRKIIGPDRMKKLSVHARGEILTELATGYTHVGKFDKARALWNEALKAVPDSQYSKKAELALKAMDDRRAAGVPRSGQAGP